MAAVRVTAMLDAGWLLQRTLSLGGLVLALAGVAIFGWHFIRLNAQAARSDSGAIPTESWRGPGARFGYSIFAAGVVLAAASMILAAGLPSHY
jgi:hypothetical protein